jgi:HEPN domain-containing protein
MNRTDLQDITEIRLRDTKALLDNGCYQGAYYLSGYAIECGLKACIAKQTKQHDFPDRKIVNQSYTHDIESLFRVAGLWDLFRTDVDSDSNLEVNWNVVKDWNEETRYDKGIPEEMAKDLYAAIIDQQHGVLQWIKQHW